MAGISLVVCVYKEKDLLERLLRETKGCYDDLVIVHDGPEREEIESGLQKPAAIDYAAFGANEPLPAGYRVPPAGCDPGGIHELVHAHGGRYFEGGRSFQQEPHWPFAWSRARYDWILRLDADEFPSEGLKAWLQAFRSHSEPSTVSGYTCIWPLWDGRRAVTQRWPDGRSFLFHRQRVKFVGMVELVPFPDSVFAQVEHALHHQPRRKSYGVRNIAFRRQAFHWRRVIARSLLGRPTDVPHWRWCGQSWPQYWRYMREHPLQAAFRSLLFAPFWQGREMWKQERSINLSALAGTGLHHFILGLTVFAYQRRRERTQ